MHLIVTIAFLMMFGQGVIGAATAKPLEHSPGELAWADWIQQESKQADPHPPPRRITTKSLFVFPNLGPEALPACADGYRPDSMGRCVKVVKVDETAHLEFLLQQLNSQFATEVESDNSDDLYDYVDTEPPDTSGPFQFNIPIGMQAQGPKPEDSEGSGDTVILFKKEAPLSIINKIDTKPPQVSSPEFVPGDDDVKSSLEKKEPISVNNQTKNSTDSETIIPISINGKFENVSSNVEEKNNEFNDITKEFENTKNSTNEQSKIDIEKVVTKAIDAAATSILKTLLEEIAVNHSQPTDQNVIVNNKTMILKNMTNNSNIIPETLSTTNTTEKLDILVQEIEALRDISNTENTKTSTINDDDKNEENKIKSISNEKINQIPNDEDILIIDLKSSDNSDTGTDKKNNYLPQVDLDIEKDLETDNSNNFDNIEEKIKVISRYADVTRNTEDNSHVLKQEQKKTSNNLEIYPYIPQPQHSISLYSNPSHTNKPQAPSNIVRFPVESKNIPGNQIGSQEYFMINKNHPYNSQKTNYPSGNIRHKPPYWWLPHSWDIEQPKEEHNLMSFWSRMPLIPEYPYRNNPDHNRHLLHYQSPYLNSHETNSRINLRHTSVNHRRGRLYNRDRQMQHEEPFIYARSRHPHYRE